jgi:hypothetical protein
MVSREHEQASGPDVENYKFAAMKAIYFLLLLTNPLRGQTCGLKSVTLGVTLLLLVRLAKFSVFGGGGAGLWTADP